MKNIGLLAGLVTLLPAPDSRRSFSRPGIRPGSIRPSRGHGHRRKRPHRKRQRCVFAGKVGYRRSDPRHPMFDPIRSTVTLPAIVSPRDAVAAFHRAAEHCAANGLPIAPPPRILRCTLRAALIAEFLATLTRRIPT